MAFGRKNDAPTHTGGGMETGINVYLGAGTTFEGRLEFTGTAQISGTFKGEIASQGTLVVGNGGQVEGEFKVGQINIAGKVTGNMECSHKAILQRSAVCEGELRTPKLEMEDGAVFQGTISMARHAAEEKKK